MWPSLLVTLLRMGWRGKYGEGGEEVRWQVWLRVVVERQPPFSSLLIKIRESVWRGECDGVRAERVLLRRLMYLRWVDSGNAPFNDYRNLT